MISRKGIELSLNTIVIAIIVIAVLLVVLLIFGKYIGLEITSLDKTHCDFDSDGMIDAADPCPCLPASVTNNPAATGCRTCELKSCKNKV